MAFTRRIGKRLGHLIKRTSNYDAIVIGAGHNGLTNAAFLAKAGPRVLVVEKNPYAGIIERILKHLGVWDPQPETRSPAGHDPPWSAGGRIPEIYEVDPTRHPGPLPDQAEKMPGTWLTDPFGPGRRMQRPVCVNRDPSTK